MVCIVLQTLSSSDYDDQFARKTEGSSRLTTTEEHNEDDGTRISTRL